MSDAKRDRHFNASDLHAIGAIALTVIDGVINLVEDCHRRISCARCELGDMKHDERMTYHRVRKVTATVRHWCDVIAHVTPPTQSNLSSEQRENVIAALNGVVGDYLAASGNPLAIPMRLRHAGVTLELTRKGLTDAFSNRC